MTGDPANIEWRMLRIALGVVAVILVADVVGWKIHDLLYPEPTRLEQTIRCLNNEKGVATVVPAGDPLADSAGSGSLSTTIEGNGVTVALAESTEEAGRIESGYRAVADNLVGRLERRDRSVYLWRSTSSPTQRQSMYDCQY